MAPAAGHLYISFAFSCLFLSAAEPSVELVLRVKFVICHSHMCRQHTCGGPESPSEQSPAPVRASAKDPDPADAGSAAVLAISFPLCLGRFDSAASSEASLCASTSSCAGHSTRLAPPNAADNAASRLGSCSWSSQDSTLPVAMLFA